MRRLLLFLSLLTALSLIAAACGGDDGEEDAGEAATEADTDEVAEESDGEEAEADEGEEADEPADEEADEAAGGDLPLSDMNFVSRDELTQGGELRFAISLLPGNWNGLNVDGNTVPLDRIDDFVMPNNWIYAEDASFEPDPDYIESYDVAEATDTDPQVVTLNLNPDAVWNSGDTIDWEDYQATWSACNGENEEFNCASTDGFNQITAVEQGDSPTQVVVTFENAYPDWSAVLSTVYPAEGVADAATFNEAWAGTEFNPDWHTGPFAFDSLNEAERILTLVPNPNWWGNAPLLDTVSFQELQNPADVQAFANGEVDVVETMIDSNSVDLAQNRPDGEIRTAGSLQWRHFTFNSTDEILQDEAGPPGHRQGHQPRGHRPVRPRRPAGRRGPADAGQPLLHARPAGLHRQLRRLRLRPGRGPGPPRRGRLGATRRGRGPGEGRHPAVDRLRHADRRRHVGERGQAAPGRPGRDRHRAQPGQQPRPTTSSRHSPKAPSASSPSPGRAPTTR